MNFFSNCMLVIIVFLLMISSCLNKPSLTHNDNSSVEIDGSLAFKNLFNPDISVNGIILNNSLTVESKLGDLMPMLDKNEDLPNIYIYGKDSIEYLKMIFLPGSENNSFSFFEVGRRSSVIKNNANALFVNYKEFQSESGVKIGLTKDDVIRIKGKKFITIKNNVIRYLVDDFENSPFLKKFNMPLYFAQYEFDDRSILINYKFGFDYP